MEPIKLAQENLATIASRGISVPKYNRTAVKAGILHFGIGHFHRAHQAVYLDRLMNLGRENGALEWGIVGAEVMDLPFAVERRKMLEEQDFLSTIVAQDVEGSEVRVIGSMVDFLPVGHSQAIINKMADPAIRIVSLTITEGGYFIDSATGKFNPAHPDIQADAASPDAPKTVFGLIIAGLKRRKLSGLVPFTVLSCDNIPHNGDVARNACVSLAALFDPSLAEWIGQCVAFPNGMVDRITPSTGDKERRVCKEQLGILDGWPIFCERFSQWVLEDIFPAGRPALEEVGVQFVPDVAPFERMKLRILNGGHALVAYASALLGIRLVHDAVQNDLVRSFLRKVVLEEIVPLLPPVPGHDLVEYFEQFLKRMENAQIEDTSRRLCMDGSNRQPKFIIPSIFHGSEFTGLALASALWCRYCFGMAEDGMAIPANDPAWTRLQMVAQKAKQNPVAWLEMEDIYGEVGKSRKFRAVFALALEAVWHKGTAEVLREFIQ